MRRRRGFVLLVVLWAIVGLSALSLAGSFIVRDAVAAATNRVSIRRAAWLAEGCLNAALSSLSAELESDAGRWNSLDSASVPLDGRCHLTLIPAGLSLNVNRTTAPEIARVLGAAGLPPHQADSLTGAILDWRDANDDPMVDGAESDWYRERGRLAPRNAPFGAAEELLLVRGAERLPGIDTLFGIEDDPVLLTRASPAVLAGLPGLADEAIAAMIEARERSSMATLEVIAERLSAPAREHLLQTFAELRARTTATPTAWYLTAHARTAPSEPKVSEELKVVRDGSRLAVVRRRTWP